MKKILLIGLVIVLGVIGAGGFIVLKSMQGTPPSALEQQYLTDADRYVEVDGARIRLREEGPEDAPVIILLHGFTFSLESFDAWAADLSTDYRVIRYDLLGHGLTGPDPMERYSPIERAEFVRSVMDTLDIDTATIGGNSLGGLVAWRFAATNPSRVDSLILVDAAAYSINGVTDQPAEIPAAMKGFLLTVPEAGVDATINLVYADPAKASAERRQLLGDMMRREGNGEAFIRHLEEFTLPEPERDLARISAPTLILWGAEDRMIPASQGRAMADAIQGAEIVIYPGVGHAPQEEAPAETLADVRAFLNQQD
ncbi:alpha/beta hydrolase [Parvularcula flava]|uniref:Alpha/beta hydrolase n=1 Tax=Aquisalinus luteolus TaxID=1566827 RepID=A0A8J3EV31_9PROT|nr:alpha/beta hydrolase [Aquisalinus luteolus]NHK28675.1 alpha/beta hydrolase [Aquisalinus luteolus]GGH99184.1 alpha/beta hydrolase [Aquisalinus luteolus]